ncbi:MAG: agmatinase family protein [Bacteroidota bacterium]
MPSKNDDWQNPINYNGQIVVFSFLRILFSYLRPSENTMSREEKVKNFNPDGVGQANGNLFGLPFTYEESRIAILPVPWDVTVSYSDGTSDGPQAILDASTQLDFNDPDFPDAWKTGFFLTPVSVEWKKLNDDLRNRSTAYIDFLENGGNLSGNEEMQSVVQEVNTACDMLRQRVFERTTEMLNDGKFVALLGGDHSTPLGFIQALAKKHEDFAILQIDAHCDLRESYEGFTYSHASIMFNALKTPQVKKLVQVGIRDYCRQESEMEKKSGGRIKIFYDRYLKHSSFEGKTWNSLCDEIISELPEKVYISFDIDGLDPKLCPGTGTPVPGGLEFEQAVYLFKKLTDKGHTIIGFDLNEVSPGNDEWNANVGARMLWKLCVFAAKSNNL